MGTGQLSVFHIFDGVSTRVDTIINNAARNRNAFLTTALIIRCHYFFLLFYSFSKITGWNRYLDMAYGVPLWPVFWIDLVNFQTAVNIIMILFLAGTAVAALFPEHRAARVFAFAGLLEFVALDNSGGKVVHQMHVWVITSFILIFLTDKWNRVANYSRGKKNFFLVFWGCQALVLLTYSMAGLGKLYGAWLQFQNGENTVFHPTALAYHIAAQLAATKSISPLGPWFIDHPWIGWPFLVGAVYLQFFSFWIAFRPSLHRLWGCFLIAFHIGTYLIMGVVFTYPVMLLALLFIISPFQQENLSWNGVLEDLPLVGLFIRKARIYLQNRNI